MWTITFLVISLIIGAIGIRFDYPDEYHSSEEYYGKPMVRYVHPRMNYVHVIDPHYVPDNYGGYYTDSMKKTVHEAEKTGLETSKGSAADHKLVEETSGHHGFEEGSQAKKLSGKDIAVSEKSKEYGKTSKDGYGGHSHSGFKNGHKETGFDKSYNKQESGKDSHYYDEDHKSGGEMFGKSYDEMSGEGGKEGRYSSRKGTGYEYEASGHGKGGSGHKSVTGHDSKSGHSDHENSYKEKDMTAHEDHEGSHGRSYGLGRHDHN